MNRELDTLFKEFEAGITRVEQRYGQLPNTGPSLRLVNNEGVSTEPTLDPDPKKINCCQAMYYGILAHAKGSEHFDDAKEYYRKAMTGSHEAARLFTSWIDEGKNIKIPLQNGKVTDQAAIRDAISEAKKDDYKLDEAQQRGLVFASEFSKFCNPPIDHLWHSLRMLFDINEAGGNYTEVKESVKRVGPIHNVLDAHGIPVPGLLRERLPSEEDGWLDLDLLEFASGDFAVAGTPSGGLVPLLTQADLDVAAHLAFLEGPEPVAPSFSLDKAPSERTDMRLDRKTFNPAWLAATPFGQSMYLADWLMKTFTMYDGLPSLTDPLFCGAAVKDWKAPDFMQAISKANGSFVLHDGTRASHGRLEIVVLSADVFRASIRKMLFWKVNQYRLNKIDLFVESSVYGGHKDACDTEHHFRNDPSTRPGARAAIIMENYQHITDSFPVFERVGLILAVFSIMCQARRDGIELSFGTRQRIAQRLNSYKADYERNYPKYELSPKPFHQGGCTCRGGVSGRTTATVSSTQTQPFVERAGPRNVFGSNGNNNGDGSAKEDFNWESIRPEWTTWAHYQKENMGGETYAKIAGRYYSRHAVQGMNLPAYGYYAGDPNVAQEKYVGAKKNIETGHSISPRYVENCIRNGSAELQSNNRYKFVDGNVRVVMDFRKRIVISVGYEK